MLAMNIWKGHVPDHGVALPRTVKVSIREFLHAESGATAIEYGLIAALVVMAAVVGFTALGSGIIDLYVNVIAANVLSAWGP